MKILVTGNRGYIGQVLTNELLKKGHHVVGWDCNYFEHQHFGRKDVTEAIKNVPHIEKDLRDIRPEDLKGFDAVIHTAALPNDPACDLVPDVCEDINYLTTVQIATFAKRAGVKRFIFASSCSVFGVNGDDLINESSMPFPLTPYGVSKLNSEIALKAMNSENFTVTCMRNATCYGVSPRMRFDMVLNNLVGYAFTEGKIKMLSDGMAWRPLVHIEDIAHAYMLVLEAPKEDVGGEVFAVGSENFRVKEIANIIKKIMPEAVIEIVPGAQRDFRSYKVSFSKINKILGFKPKWTAEKGAEELLNAYKEFGLTKESFQERHFWAGKQFKHLLESGKVHQNLKFKHL